MYIHIHTYVTYTTVCLGISVLKKHYSILLSSLPSDHLVTLSRLCNFTPLDDDVVDRIIASPDSPTANKKILDLLILMIGSNSGLLDFCNSMEKILQDQPAVLVPLRNGKLCRLIHVYIVTYIRIRILYGSVYSSLFRSLLLHAWSQKDHKEYSIGFLIFGLHFMKIQIRRFYKNLQLQKFSVQ